MDSVILARPWIVLPVHCLELISLGVHPVNPGGRAHLGLQVCLPLYSLFALSLDDCCHTCHILLVISSPSFDEAMSGATDIPDEQTLSRVSDLLIYNSKGEEVKFGSLFEENKTVVVFVRTFHDNRRVQLNKMLHEPLSGHFFCGVCNIGLLYAAYRPQNLGLSSEIPAYVLHPSSILLRHTLDNWPRFRKASWIRPISR